MDTGTALLALLRGAHLAALLSLFGTLLFGVMVAPAGLRAAPAAAAAQVRSRLTRQARLSLLLALALGIAWLAAEAQAIAMPSSLRTWLAALPAVALGTRFGQVLAFRLVLLLAILKLLRRAPIAAIASAGLAIALQPALGHAGEQGGAAGVMLAGSEALHLLAAGAWFGGLLALLVCITRLPPSQAASACERFTPIGLVSIGVIAITAFLQGGHFVGSVPGLLGTGYGRLVLLKLGLFAAALGLAVLNRRRFIPSGVMDDSSVASPVMVGPRIKRPRTGSGPPSTTLVLPTGKVVDADQSLPPGAGPGGRHDDGDVAHGSIISPPCIIYGLTSGEPARARRRLCLSVGIETAIGLTIVLASGFLASFAPATQEQPLWPFSWRLSVGAIEDPDIRGQVALALAAAGVGVASAVVGLLWRRARVVLVTVGACLLLAAMPAVRLLLVEAYPTSYYRSPTGFAATSIVHGGTIFAANCAGCHGAEGHGDGPLAAQLPLRPADLTATHLWGHSDGELFWWVSNGRQTTDGTQLMPAFAPLLPDADRWDVIDFVRANNAGSSERSGGAWAVPIVAPAMPVVCAGIPADEMQDLHGSVVRVVADGDEEGVSHPPAIPPQEGYKVLILHLNRARSAPVPQGECMAATPAAWGAYATLVGLRPDALPGAEFLVDPNGWLRAAWLPGSGRGWSTPDQLIAQVRLICTHPIAIDTGGAHEHHD